MSTERSPLLDARIRTTAQSIARTQHSDGSIPWFERGILDPWDHTEAAMGLSIGGHHEAAVKAYDWLRKHQRADGAWFAGYKPGTPSCTVIDGTRAESNFVAYVATGVWHHYLVTNDDPFLRRMWPMVAAAMEFVLSLQAPTGEIYWALDSRTGINKDALVTGCSSIYKSLDCGIQIARTLGEPVDAWATARTRLGDCLRLRPDRFDRTWPSKARYSMDWFYPVLTGVFTGEAAKRRLEQRWHEFVEPDLGCRCVADEPWVTVAESCELTLALLAAGDRKRAEAVFANLATFEAEDGSWWTGYVFTDRVFWPDERPTWTAGAVLLALDGLLGLTDARGLFARCDLSSAAAQHAERSGFV